MEIPSINLPRGSFPHRFPAVQSSFPDNEDQHDVCSEIILPLSTYPDTFRIIIENSLSKASWRVIRSSKMNVIAMDTCVSPVRSSIRKYQPIVNIVPNLDWHSNSHKHSLFVQVYISRLICSCSATPWTIRVLPGDHICQLMLMDTLALVQSSHVQFVIRQWMPL